MSASPLAQSTGPELNTIRSTRSFVIATENGYQAHSNVNLADCAAQLQKKFRRPTREKCVAYYDPLRPDTYVDGMGHVCGSGEIIIVGQFTVGALLNSGVKP